MRTLLIALCGVAVSGMAFGNTGKSLSEILENAAASGEKYIKLEGEFRLDRPVKIGSSLGGATIDGGGKTVVSGGELLTGWVRDGKFLKTKAENVEALFVNGVRANAAQDGFCFFNSQYGRNSFVVRNADIKSLDGVPQNKISNSYLDLYSVWMNARCKILRLERNPDGLTTTVFVENPFAASFTTNDLPPVEHKYSMNFILSKWDKNMRFRVSNAFAALDEEGEFYFDAADKTLWYYPRNGETPENIRAVSPKLSRLFDISGESAEKPVRNLTIKGITFEHCGHFPTPDWRQSPQAAFSVRGAVFVQNAENFAFLNNTVRYTNNYGLELKNGVNGAIVEGNEFFDNGCGGVRIGDAPNPKLSKNDISRNIAVRDNIIYRYGRYDKAGVGVLYLDVHDISVEHNTIFDGFYTGVSGGWTWGFAPANTGNNRIVGNRIFNIGFGVLCDMGGIYTLGEHLGSVISGNHINGVYRHRYGGWGIYNDEGSRGFVVENNYVHDVAEDSYHQHYGKNNTVRNNVFVCGGTSQIALSRLGEKYPDELVFERNVVVYRSPSEVFRNAKKVITRLNGKFASNLYWKEDGTPDFFGMPLEKWQSEYGQDKGSIIANPKLKNGIPQSDVVKKIGFVPFDTSDAGARGGMKKRAAEILDGYEFPPVLNLPKTPLWTKAFLEDFGDVEVGEPPLKGRIFTQDADIRVMSDSTGRFARYTDKARSDGKNFLPYMLYSASLAKADTGALSFEIRVNKTSTFSVELRGNTGFEGPAFKVSNGKLKTPNGLLDIPQGKWLKAEMAFKLGADKSYTVSLLDGGKKLYEAKIPEYKAEAMSSFGDILVMQTSNRDGDTFDIRNIAFKPKSR
ncbi:right-handed parallel beta-helix repeat-containing protein [Opitutia bacterium KCR 482]|nr:right-handed parallel beta-helix repeat-containing protein [Opitutae bacterium KCR 482]